MPIQQQDEQKGGGGNPFLGGGGSSSGGSSSGGSSSGGGGGGAPALPPIELYLTILQNLGIPLDDQARAFAQRARANRWTQTEFLFHLRQTRFYQEAFPGIMDRHGRLRMSEAQYIAQRRQFEDIAATLGLRLSDAMIEQLFEREISPAVFRIRAQAVRTLRDNPVLFDQFREVLSRHGERQLKREGLLRFITGLGPQRWYDIWQEAQARAAVVQAGLQVGKGELGVGKKMVERLAGQFSPADLQKGFEELAGLFLEVLPESQIRGMGLSKETLAQAVFGGKRAAQAREIVRRLQETIQAFETEERAAEQLVPTAQGVLALGGRRRTPASE